jgi:hypothetical protein
LIRWCFVSGFVLLSTSQIAVTASAQAVTPSAQQPTTPTVPTPGTPPKNAEPSAYSLDATTLSIPYTTNPNDNGVSSIEFGAPMPKGQKINWATSSGVPPAEGILITWGVSYKGAQQSFSTTNAVMRKADSYSLDDPTELVTKLMTWIKTKLPRDFDPTTVIVLDSTVTVTISPILPADTKPSTTPPVAATNPPTDASKDAPKAATKKDTSGYDIGTPTRTSNNLTITFAPG